MKAIGLKFRIAVNTTHEILLNILENLLGTLNQLEGNNRAYQINNCVIEIRKNIDYNENLTDDPEKGFLYYHYNLDVYPVTKDVTLESQINLSKSMRIKFLEFDIKCEIISEFEHLL